MADETGLVVGCIGAGGWYDADVVVLCCCVSGGETVCEDSRYLVAGCKAAVVARACCCTCSTEIFDAAACVVFIFFPFASPRAALKTCLLRTPLTSFAVCSSSLTAFFCIFVCFHCSPRLKEAFFTLSNSRFLQQVWDLSSQVPSMHLNFR